jgi:ElaB/YqjD/DUF883 family membrane-anchored ribosome-binding protein
MDERGMDRAQEATAEAARQGVDAAREAADRAGSYVQAQMTRVSARAQDLAEDANARVTELTGRPIESWAAEARTAVREHPLAAIAVAIGFGYVVGKLVMRG